MGKSGRPGTSPRLQRVEERLALRGLGRVPRRRSLAVRLQRAAERRQDGARDTPGNGYRGVYNMSKYV